MFSSIGWGEVLVLGLAALFVLGPERIPDAAAWLGRTVRRVKQFTAGAQDQLRSELGSEFDEIRAPLDELRRLRGRDPRRAMFDALIAEDPGQGVPDKPRDAPRPGRQQLAR